ADTADYAKAAAHRGINVQIFGLTTDNARAFWNWKFLGPQPDLPQTRKMLMRACDTRLLAGLKKSELDTIATALVSAATDVMGAELAFGT
ncbi:MAG: DegT/DnrJ/EryC1/StrS family aminotransferase, partial [Paracoccaceae bacterium]